MIDWGLGHYEHTAAELAPVAEHVVSLASLRPGDDVIDIATGTGNAALLASRLGTTVTGIDAATRLIEIARSRASAEGLSASFVVGDLQALPFEDGAFDAALSVFGLIFAADAERAFAEMIRVLRPGRRAFVSVWVPAGPIDAMVGTFVRAMAAAVGALPRRFPWNDSDAVGDLASRHGAELRWHDGELTIEAASPEEYFAANEQHPMSVAGRPMLDQAGSYQAVRAEALEILRSGNEDPHAFRVTSPYRVIEVLRSAENGQ